MITFNYFTADTHFGSERALNLSKRPFDNINEMDECMINNICRMTKPSDTLFHLGDFGDYDRLKEINCHVYLLLGNYEEKEMKEKFHGNFFQYRKYLMDLGFSDVFQPNLNIIKENLAIKDPEKITAIPNVLKLVHKPEDVDYSLYRGKPFSLFGHIHGRQKIKKFGIDVGVDAHFFRPVSIEDIDFYFNAIINFYDHNVFM